MNVVHPDETTPRCCYLSMLGAFSPTAKLPPSTPAAQKMDPTVT